MAKPTKTRKESPQEKAGYKMPARKGEAAGFGGKAAGGKGMNAALKGTAAGDRRLKETSDAWEPGRPTKEKPNKRKGERN